MLISEKCKQMRCIITGSNGYVGSAICRVAALAGYEVIRWQRQGGDVPFVLGQAVEPRSLDGVDALIHCAYDFKPVRWEDIQRVNVDGSIALLHAAKLAGIKRIIFISSISAYDGCRSYYGRAKLEVERYVREIGGAVIRPGLVYGETSGGMVGSLERVVERSSVVPVVGAEQQMFLCHEDDLCELTKKLLQTDLPFSSEPVLAASPQPKKFKKILQTLAERKNRRPILVPVPWQFAWCAIKAAEGIGLRPGFRSDSLISLAFPNPAPSFESARASGVTFRDFV